MRVHLLSTALVLGLVAVPTAAQRAGIPRSGPAFQAPRSLHELVESPASPGARASGDLDGDGDVDLVLLEGLGTPTGVQSWLNDGRGHFQLAHRFSFAPWLFDIARNLALADFDGDGVLDLAYDRWNPNSPGANQGVLVHLGLGDGSFAPAILAPASAFQRGFVVGDCDGDGAADLLAHESTTSSTSRFAWLRLEGGTLVAGVPLGLPEAGWTLRASLDVDGNGVADAVVTRGTSIRVLRTVSSTPTLGPEVVLPTAIPVASYQVLAGDLDGEGDADLLVVLWQLGFPEPDALWLQPIRNDGGSLTLTPFQSIVEPAGTVFGTFSIQGALGDWDGDGDLDWVSPVFAWLENTGGLHFEPVSSWWWGGLPPWTELQVVDLDGDGRLDALAGRTCAFGQGRFPGPGSAQAPGGLRPFRMPAWTCLEDWEGDGDPDLTDSDHLYLNNGDGTFASRSTPLPPVPGVSGAPTELGWADFDGDGFRDRVVRFDRYPPVFEGVFLFTGTESGAYLLSPTVPSPSPMTGALSGDLDGDGDVDILAQSGYWANDGTGVFGSAPIEAYVGLPRVTGDLDGDGDLDLVVARQGTHRLLENLGGLSFQSQSLGNDSGFPAFLDLDQDGDLDLLVVRSSLGRIDVYETLPGAVLADPFPLAVPDVVGPVGQLDLDLDGRFDLAVGLGTSEPHYRIAVWPRGDGLDFSERREWWCPDLPRAFGDLDGDGDAEPVGNAVFENLRFDGPAHGKAVQYGLDAATPGTGGRHPFLGVRGAVRRGEQLSLVIGGGRGGASGFLLRGEARRDVVAGGYRSLVAAPESVRAFVLGGEAGAAGAGSIVLRTPVSYALVGRTFDYQAVLVDPEAGAGLSATNGLELCFGDWLPLR